MSFGLPSVYGLCIVNDRDEPVPIASNVKDYIAIHVVCILEYVLHFREISPPHGLDDAHPRSDFVDRIRVVLHRRT